MRASFENMQRGAAVSQRAGGGFNRNARARRGNNQSEHRDALGPPARRRLLRERGTPQDAVGKMKVSESIDIEFLQAERLQDFFAFHCRCPIRQVMEVSGHNFRVPYSKLFLQVVAQSRLRAQRKINRCQMTRFAGSWAPSAAAPPDASARLNALARQYAPSTFEETERAGGRNADKLDRRAFKGAAGIFRERHVLCKDR